MKILDVPRSGSYQGITSSRNRNGQYVRTRAIPVNPKSVAQILSRTRMGGNAAAWKSLTSSQRAGWGSLGLLMTRSDSLGQSYTMTGFQAYCSINNNKLLAGDVIVADAPAKTTPDSPDSLTLTLTTASMSLAFTPTPMPAATRLICYASPQRSAGRSFEADYRFLSASSVAAASPIVLLTAYTAKFGVPVLGNRIFVSAIAYNGGFLGAPIITSGVVA